MPELGKYAVYVLAAYGGVAVLIGLVAASLTASARARRELEALEARGALRRKGDG